MLRRPYIQKGVAELEKLFDQQRGDLAFLENLIAELTERTVPRAQALRQRAVQAMGAIQKPPPPVVTGNPKVSPALSPQSTPNRPASIIPAPVKAVPSPPAKAQMRERPRIENKASDILSAWTAMEVLSPPSFRKPEDLVSGDRYRIASLENGRLPWEDGGEKSRSNQRLYYQVILGTIDLERATSALLQVYADTRAERPSAQGEAVLATIMVDKEGRPVEIDAVAISSFSWGVPVALSGGLHNLGRWPQIEKDLVDGAVKKVVLKDKNGEVQPLTTATINATFEWLVKQIDIDTHFVKPPSFAVRSYQYFKLQDPPESILLNSFYLDDLAKAKALVDRGNATLNLMRYLGITKPASRRNLMKDNEALAHALEPKKFPLGSWPGMGRHPLALLQQCAVNLALDELKRDGILAVTGRPAPARRPYCVMQSLRSSPSARKPSAPTMILRVRLSTQVRSFAKATPSSTSTSWTRHFVGLRSSSRPRTTRRSRMSVPNCRPRMRSRQMQAFAISARFPTRC